MKILVMMTGGTISQKAVDGKMQIVFSSEELLSRISTSAELTFIDVAKVSGAELQLQHLFDIKNIVKNHDDFDGYLLITGTDSLEEIAFGLDQLIPPEKSFVITGAVKPADAMGYDGEANLHDALKVIQSPISTKLGILVTINEDIHVARYLRKQDSSLIGTFKSHPGPIGQIRRGEAVFYYTSVPSYQRTLNSDKNLINNKVSIWTMALDPCLDESTLEHLDGLVIAGMGTGSVANSIVDQLSPKWTSKIPIVITSRCQVGLNYDDYYYKGSLQKYEEKGFRIIGYEELNPLQARIKLMLELAT
ncbi:asparaginase domain-containing protein [Acaryochloris sp. CCMEE 5410]|uniref:asparaginase domain-containing protein n=1 Tax=Acaryochloris sp. CCMEE 5410 TaxID=310037 RepID=UPI00024846FF|nr:asparaginase domain-containing protein [Acaryochloris sp. CCMEE 5410]KAI9129047.1 asparaginase [Acaryochloris sp. CCMEE 5410]